MDKKNLVLALEQHKNWLAEVGGQRAELRSTTINNINLSGVNLSYADLSCTDFKYSGFRGADLSNANLSNTDLSYVDLAGADLSNANLSNAKLVGANLAGAILKNANMNGTDLTYAGGLVKQIDYIAANFEKVADGYIAYIVTDAETLLQGCILNENVNFNRSNHTGSGIIAAPLDYMLRELAGRLWRVLIKFEWLGGVCVPYSTTGKIRCERVQLIQPVKNDVGFIKHEK